jgi:transcriptional regulator with XRE-family HTH domain
MEATQCRAARALLGWSQAELAQRSHISTTTIAKFEGGLTTPVYATQLVLKMTFEKAGIVFQEEGGPGVQLKRKKAK